MELGETKTAVGGWSSHASKRACNKTEPDKEYRRGAAALISANMGRSGFNATPPAFSYIFIRRPDLRLVTGLISLMIHFPLGLPHV